ncbi:hypothetical protein APR41_16005 [Salegentibacter salinarum]|uniref:Uncharacterized protein n=1 Tax=Salegentibacter salinarum TaxID=447422 RepID=A0A2N0TXI5_9FLAO|nr:hypothetical protein APR41_16005 [Salegentibacter salinarum]SKB91995.1 Heparinase II/III N-terminus [Salegentibacter salinarum]
MRRKFSFVGFSLFEGFLVKFSNILNDYHRHHKTLKFFKPVEVLLNQNIENRNTETKLLEKVYKEDNFRQFILSTKNLERNEAFRWNAFYPLYSLLEENNDREDVLEVCKDYISNWIELFLKKGKSNPFCWYDMADSFRLILLYRIVQTESLNFSKSESKRFDYAIKLHEFFLKKDYLLQKGNHQIFQRVARLLIFQRLENFVKLKKEKESVVELFGKQFSKEGVHQEHSPEYHLWATFVFEELRIIFDINELKDKILKCKEISSFFITPNNEIPLIGDSGLDHKVSYSKMFKNSSRDFHGNLYLKDYLLSISNQTGWYFSSILSTNSRIHKHKDTTSFELFLQGNKIITDAGKFTYSKSEFNKNIRSEQSHNLAFVVSKPDYFSLSTYKIEKIMQVKDFQMVKISSELQKKIHERLFIFNQKDHLIIVDLFSDNRIACNINLVDSKTYFVKKDIHGELRLYSNLLETEVSFLNISKISQKKNYISYEYQERHIEHSYEVFSETNYIITSILKGTKGFDFSIIGNNIYILKVGVHNIQITLKDNKIFFQ